MGNHCKVIKSPPPLRQPCPRWGLNRACDAVELSVLSSFKTDPLIRRYRNSGMPQRRGRSPQERQICTKNFYKADIFNNPW